MFVIWSYEHDAWWRPNRCGYTTKLSEAGRYSGAEAGEIVINSIHLEEIAIHEGALTQWYESHPPKFHPYKGNVDESAT